MKKRLVLIKSIVRFSLIMIIPLINSCAIHHGTLSSNAVLIDKNFKIVGIGVGESESMKVLGFGGFKNDALVYNAKTDLYNKSKLNDGQALTNITVDFKREFYLVFSKTKVTVTAEIVDFNKHTNSAQTSSYGVMERKNYRLGEDVFAKLTDSYKKCTITKLDLGRAKVRLYDQEANDTLQCFIKYDELFRIKGDFTYHNKKYKVGDLMQTEFKKHKGSRAHYAEMLKGNIVGISDRYALLLDKHNDNYFIVNINK